MNWLEDPRVVGAMAQETEKLAKTRYDKEIEAGNIHLRDLVSRAAPDLDAGDMHGPAAAYAYKGRPGSVDALNPTKESVRFDRHREVKRGVRDMLSEHKGLEGADLDLRRKINQKAYEQQMAHPLASTGMDLTTSSARHPATYAGTMHDAGKTRVVVPSDVSRSIRGALQGKGANPAIQYLTSLLPARLRDKIDAKFMAPASPEDSTVNKAIWRHEVGEAAELDRVKRAPGEVRNKSKAALTHASHFGTTPILEENLHAMGDHGAVDLMQRMRQMHPEDARVQGMIRSVGGTPNSPVPIGGRQQRALDKMLARSVGRHGKSQSARQLDYGFGSTHHTDLPSHLPGRSEVNAALKRHIPDALAAKGGILAKLRQLANVGPLLDRVKGVAAHLS